MDIGWTKLSKRRTIGEVVTSQEIDTAMTSLGRGQPIRRLYQLASQNEIGGISLGNKRISGTMRFDNSARMQQLDGILKPKKSRKSKASGLSVSSGKSGEESRTSSRGSSGRKGKDLISDASTYAESTAHNTTTSASRSSLCSRGSRSLQSKCSKTGPVGCKHVVLLQDSWDKLKASQINEADIGENIMFRLIDSKAWSESKSFSAMKNFHPDRIDYFAKLILATIDSIVSLAGPNLFEEDFEKFRLVWIDEGLRPLQVSSVLLDGLRDSTTQDIFSENVLQAWLSTIVQLLISWETNN